MTISEFKSALSMLQGITFKLPDGGVVPAHFHVTEVGLVTKHFIDCGGVERKETVANFQLWEADDFDHRLAPSKLVKILEVSEQVLGVIEDFEIEVEYQQETIGKFGLEFMAGAFRLTPKRTACLAEDACGIPGLRMSRDSVCDPGSGCC